MAGDKYEKGGWGRGPISGGGAAGSANGGRRRALSTWSVRGSRPLSPCDHVNSQWRPPDRAPDAVSLPFAVSGTLRPARCQNPFARDTCWVSGGFGEINSYWNQLMHTLVSIFRCECFPADRPEASRMNNSGNPCGSRTFRSKRAWITIMTFEREQLEVNRYFLYSRMPTHLPLSNCYADFQEISCIRWHVHCPTWKSCRRVVM